MVSLIDIVPQTRIVEIEAGPLELRGLGLRHVADLLVRFPELRKLFVDNAPALDADALIQMAPDACGAIIAEAAGQPEAADNIAAALPLEDFATCLEAVIALTMPSGIGPFMDRLGTLLGGVGGARPGRDPDTNTPPPPNN